MRRPADGHRPFRRRARSRSPVRPAAVAAVAAGGAVGGSARYGVEVLLPHTEGSFPWATFAVNVTGALLLSVLLVLILEVWPPRRHLRAFVAIGMLGSFTTFSTWMLEAHDLAARGAWLMSAAYVFGSLLAGLAVAGLGVMVARAATGRRMGSMTKERR